MKRTQETSDVTPVAAARRLGVELNYVYSLLRTGKLLGRKDGRIWRVPVRAIKERMAAIAR